MNLKAATLAAALFLSVVLYWLKRLRPRQRPRPRAPARGDGRRVLRPPRAQPIAAATADKVDPAKDAAIRHLMDLTGTTPHRRRDQFAYITKQVHDGLS